MGCEGGLPSMNKRAGKAASALTKGQLWKTGDGCLEIVGVKRLIHYRILKQPGERLVRTRMSSAAEFDEYLRSHGAQLVEGKNA
jgi:hypothetical protein